MKCKGFFCNRTKECGRYSEKPTDEYYDKPPYKFIDGVFICDMFLSKNIEKSLDLDELKNIFGFK